MVIIAPTMAQERRTLPLVAVIAVVAVMYAIPAHILPFVIASASVSVATSSLVYKYYEKKKTNGIL